MNYATEGRSVSHGYPIKQSKLFKSSKNSQCFIARVAEDVFTEGLEPGINSHLGAKPDLEEKLQFY